jgi:histidinol-phosphate aminotransferase
MPSTRRAFLRALGTTSLALGGPAAALGGSMAMRASPASAPAAAPSVIRLGSNENSHGPAASALSALQQSLREWNRYPYEAYGRLLPAIARHARTSTTEVVTASGSSELLDAAVSAFTSPERGLVTVSPTFERPARRAAATGAPVVAVPVDRRGRLDLDGLLARCAGAGLIYVCNPNNPTATALPAADVRLFVERVQQRTPGTTVLIDEAYHEYVELPAHTTAIPLATARPTVVVVRTFSKLYGMAGLRVGYAVGQPATLARMQPWLSTLGMSVPAAEAAMASMADTAHVEAQRAANRETRRFTVEAFARLGCEAFASDANFVMVHVGRDCLGFANACASQGVRIARPFPPLLQHARITIGTMDEMRRAMAVFERVLAAPPAEAAHLRWREDGASGHGC